VDKGLVAIAVLITLAATIGLSLTVTLPFIRRHSPDEGHYVPAIRITNFIAPYFDACTALRIAVNEPGAGLPGGTIVQCILLVAFPVLLYLYCVG